MEDYDIFKDVTIISLEQATVLPFLTYKLSLEGARVIRIEHPVYGDPNRKIGENRLNEDGMYTYFLAINCNKKAITLDLTTLEARDILKKILNDLNVDIFATNQLPKNYKKLGIDYEAISAIKKDIIWLGVTGFGPENNEAAYDPILQARTGLMDITGDRNGPPCVLGIPLPDMGTGEHAYSLIMKALYKKALTGKGSKIDISMFQSTVSWLTVPITQTKSFNKEIKRRGNTHEFFAPVSVYKTRDGYVYIAVGNDMQWERMLKIKGFKVLDKPQYKKNEGRIGDVEDLNRAIEEILANFETVELINLFAAATIPVSKVNTIEDVLEYPCIKDEMLYSTDDKSGITIYLAPQPVTTSYVKFLKRKLPFPPRLGEHNEEIYCKDLGLSRKQLKQLKAGKIV